MLTHALANTRVSNTHTMLCMPLTRMHGPPGAVRLLQPPAPGLALSVPLQLHWAECVWELPLLEVLVHLAARHAWPAPVQARALPCAPFVTWLNAC